MLLDLGRELAGAAPAPFWIATTLLALGAVAGFLFGFGQLRDARLIQDTPTSRIRSAAQGYVELEGFARLLPGPEIISPLSRARCTWWRYKVEHRESKSDGKRSEWRTVQEARSEELFLLADTSGECIIDPHGAQTWPSLKRRWQGTTRWPARIPEKSPWLSFGEYRYSEELIGIGDPLYALGLFRSQSAAQSYDEVGEVRELLRAWKSDRRELLRRFDSNRDGQLDVAEWDAARRTAIAEVRAGQLEQSLAPDLHVLCKPEDGRQFLLSTLPQSQLVGRLRRRGLGLIAVALVAGFAAVWALVQRGG